MTTALALLTLLAPLQAPGVAPRADVPERLPPDVELREEGPQRYRFVCDYLATGADDGFLRKQRLAATYVRNREEGTVRWEDASLATVAGLDDALPAGEPVGYLDGFEYEPDAGQRMFLPGFFEGFPHDPESSYARNLVWDTHMLEWFARDYWERLELGVPLTPAALEASPVPLAGMGRFENRSIELTWVGTSRRHGEPCALIRYEAFFNRFEMELGSLRIEGLSHYWGLIWVSLEDKQLEHATLDEHVSIRQLREDGGVRRSTVLRRGTLTKTSPL